MASLKEITDAIAKFFVDLKNPLTDEHRRVIGGEVGHALIAIGTISNAIAQNPACAKDPISSRLDPAGINVAAPGSVTTFELAHFVDPNMPLAEFIAGVSKAFDLWPYLITQNGRPTMSVFSTTVRDELFQGNDQGWAQYVESVRGRGLGWFGREGEGDS